MAEAPSFRHQLLHALLSDRARGSTLLAEAMQADCEYQFLDIFHPGCKR